jgi:hypothetical protein
MLTSHVDKLLFQGPPLYICCSLQHTSETELKIDSSLFVCADLIRIALPCHLHRMYTHNHQLPYY